MLLRRIQARVNELKNLLYFNEIPLEASFFQTKNDLTPQQASKKKFKTIKPGFLWGEFETYGWFKIKFKTPSSFSGKPFYFAFLVDGESLIYHNYIPVFSVNTLRDAWDFERLIYKIENKVSNLKSYEFYIEVSPFNIYDNGKKYFNKKSMFRKAALFTCPDILMKFYYDMSLLHEIAGNLDENNLRRNRIIEALIQIIEKFNFEERNEEKIVKTAHDCNKILQTLLNKKNAPTTEKFYMTGHSHLDVSWLWPFAETRKKVARTVSTTLKFMDDYKNMTFMQTTAVYYEILKQHYPELYNKVIAHIKNSRWEPGCVSYVEPDCALTSGESLVRQFLFGNRFSRQNLGNMSKVVWFPDTFGFSANLPQIIKKSGLKYLMTIKIWWNRTNKFPFCLFNWEGIDGSKILAYLPPCHYNAKIKIQEMKNAWKDFRNKDSFNEILYPYGVGDGGGGMNEEMLEYLSRLNNLEGAPKCEHSLMQDYFHVIEKKNKKLPTWKGELYLELHRGTYTTQAWNKKYNRQSEFLMKEVELFSAMGMLHKGNYAQNKINDLWKLILQNQFHDILPGTSIKRVHKESCDQYRTVLKQGGFLLDANLTYLKNKINTKGDGIPVIIFNSYSKSRSGVAEIPGKKINANFAVSTDGELTPVQKSNDKIILKANDIPPLGWKIIWLKQTNRQNKNTLKISKNLMENEFIRLEFDNKGKLISIYDKENSREILQKGEYGNKLELFVDKPLEWDAWDVDEELNDLLVDSLKIKKIEVIAEGPVMGEIKISGTIGNSLIEQSICIYAGSRRIDFKTKVIWNENKRMLKASFPVNVISDKAVYDIQFGNMERPTTSNHSWEWAQFEVFAHKWADISEGNYGVALLNNCKYGYSIKNNIMRLSLLRSPSWPDPTADKGEHEFIYSLYPHKGDFRTGQVIDEGYDLNMPLKPVVSASHTGKLNNEFSFFSVDKDNVIIETIKKAEDDKSIIVRLYETFDFTEKVKLQSAFKIKKAYECNLMEENEKELKDHGNEIRFLIKPYEIKTFKLFY